MYTCDWSFEDQTEAEGVLQVWDQPRINSKPCFRKTELQQSQQQQQKNKNNNNKTNKQNQKNYFLTYLDRN